MSSKFLVGLLPCLDDLRKGRQLFPIQKSCVQLKGQ